MTGMRIVKFYAWEPSFIERLTGLRAEVCFFYQFVFTQIFNICSFFVLFIFFISGVGYFAWPELHSLLHHLHLHAHARTGVTDLVCRLFQQWFVFV
jgi:hypothetical protein